MLSLRNTAFRCARKPRNAAYTHSQSKKPLWKQVRDPTNEPSDKWNYNKSPLFESTAEDVARFPLVTANELEKKTDRPRGVKMLARDFIEDSLYNPHYGYFSKEATIFDSHEDPFDFANIRNSVHFQEEVATRYLPYGANDQLWHTPTELFKPFYGHAIARCLVSEYLLKYFPYEDFVIYEIGAGNGTLALNILDYIRDEHPDVYERTRYTIVEISANLVKAQKKKLNGVHPCVKVINQSVFRWGKREPAPCFFLAMEVVDNFAHDVIRYDMETLQPYQGVVVVDKEGDLDMLYSPVTDPLIAGFLRLRKRLGHPIPVNRALRSSQILRKMYRSLPFAANMSTTEYIPTRMLSLLRTLRNHFPRHRLLLSDFSSLPDAIPGINAPVVQTRFRNSTIPTTTLLVRPGSFDIFFPTNFEQLRDMYECTVSSPPHSSADEFLPERSTPLTSHSLSLKLGADYFSSHRSVTNRRSPLDGVTSASGLPVGEHRSSVFTHAQFLQTYADLSRTRLRNGENPMLGFYENVKFLF
ncbi:DUF185-domain-containing protein [Mucidula mucida]|nr:DUF185-domain-containing protein [Mucidula mucida]